VLCFEADLYDQLQISEILAHLADLGVPAGRITLICIGEHAGIDRWIGGVHLRGHHVPWRWDDGIETIVHSPARHRAPQHPAGCCDRSGKSMCSRPRPTAATRSRGARC
jgi:hypothetical protein